MLFRMSLRITRKRKLSENEVNSENTSSDHFSQFISRKLNDSERESLKQQKKLRQSTKVVLPGIGNATIFSGIDSLVGLLFCK